MADRTMLLFGTDEPGPEERRLEAGALSVLYAGGALRSIAVQGVEVIRGLYFLIRDRNWATPVPEVRDLRIDETAEGFTLSFAAHCVTPADNQTIVWKARIEGSAREGLSFAVEATPDADLSTQRTGFVILHPLARCAGTAAVIEHTDGRVVASRFPDLVDPLGHVAPGRDGEVRHALLAPHRTHDLQAGLHDEVLDLPRQERERGEGLAEPLQELRGPHGLGGREAR